MARPATFCCLRSIPAVQTPPTMRCASAAPPIGPARKAGPCAASAAAYSLPAPTALRRCCTGEKCRSATSPAICFSFPSQGRLLTSLLVVLEQHRRAEGALLILRRVGKLDLGEVQGKRFGWTIFTASGTR